MRRLVTFAHCLAVGLLAACGGGGSAITDVAVGPAYVHDSPLNSSSQASGSPIDFYFQVSNAGPDVASGVPVQIQLGSNLDLVGIECSPDPYYRTAVCPSQTGLSMVVPSLPFPGWITLVIHTTQHSPGPFTATVTVTAVGTNDSDPGNNEGSWSTVVH